MNDPSRAKVMFPIGGLPMIHHVVARALECRADTVITIIGHNRQSVRSYLEEAFGSKVQFAEQNEQLGTGHAVMQAIPLLEGRTGEVLVLSGDVPLLGSETINALLQAHRESGGVATVLTVIAPDPTGYGRIVRNADGTVARIVEQKDATEEERRIDEINSGIYVFRASGLLDALSHLTNDNAQQEYYLTDLFEWFRKQGEPVAAYPSADFAEIQGINTVAQLDAVDAEFSRRGAVV